MARRLIASIGILIFAVLLTDCNGTAHPIPSTSTPEPFQPPRIPTLSFSQTATFTPSPTIIPTLLPEEADILVAELLQTNGNCPTPCVWGIVPGETNYEEAAGFLGPFDPTPLQGIFDDYQYFSISYFYKEKMHIMMGVDETNGRLVNAGITLLGLDQPVITDQDWLAFRPDSILRTYGLPSLVWIILILPPSVDNEVSVGYELLYFYNSLQLVITYINSEYVPIIDSKIHICPLVDHSLESASFNLGENMQGIPEVGWDITQATSRSLSEFYQLMIGDSRFACFDINTEALGGVP